MYIHVIYNSNVIVKLFENEHNFWPGCTGRGKTFRNSFLSNYLSQPLDIWHTALTRGPILWDPIGNFHNNFLSNYLLQPLDIWHTALTRISLTWDFISCLLLIHFLFTDLVKL
jgi:hypothetical protein